MSAADDDDARRRERARDVGLFRYALIRDAADPGLSTRARGRLVRQIAEGEHVGPFGEKVRVSRATLDRWIRAWRRGGFDALVPGPRRVTPRTPDEVLELAAALKRENPQRTAAQAGRILRKHSGWSPSERTLQRHFVRLGLNTPEQQMPEVFGRFEASRPNELWQGDALHGPVIGGHKTFLFAFIDDYSRLLVGYRFGYAEDTVRLAAAMRKALATRGVPDTIYVDHGSAYIDAWLQRACAVLGIKLTHSTPGRPEGRGKIERVFRTVREQFLVEITGEADDVAGRRHVSDLLELNRLFTAWVEQVYHRRVHSETDAEPLQRFLDAAGSELPSPQLLAEAFRWEMHRVVDKTGLVKLHDNRYETDPTLAGRKVQLVFDPFDLTRIEVRYRGKSHGLAVPHRICRHSHPKARPEPDAHNDTHEPIRASGIDYAGLIAADHAEQLAAGISYAALTSNHDDTATSDVDDTGARTAPVDENAADEQIPGQLDLLTSDGDEATDSSDVAGAAIDGNDDGRVA